MMSVVVSLSSADGTNNVRQPPREIYKISEKKYDKDLSSQMGFIWSLVSQKKIEHRFCFFLNSDILFTFFRNKI